MKRKHDGKAATEEDKTSVWSVVTPRGGGGYQHPSHNVKATNLQLINIKRLFSRLLNASNVSVCRLSYRDLPRFFLFSLNTLFWRPHIPFLAHSQAGGGSLLCEGSGFNRSQRGRHSQTLITHASFPQSGHCCVPGPKPAFILSYLTGRQRRSMKNICMQTNPEAPSSLKLPYQPFSGLLVA